MEDDTLRNETIDACNRASVIITAKYREALDVLEGVLGAFEGDEESLRNVLLNTAKAPVIEQLEFANDEERALFDAYNNVDAAKLILLMNSFGREQLMKEGGRKWQELKLEGFAQVTWWIERQRSPYMTPQAGNVNGLF